MKFFVACCLIFFAGTLVAQVTLLSSDALIAPDTLLIDTFRNMNVVDEEQILFSYAQDQAIVISDNELISYFIQQLGEHPKFCTDGAFDYIKFNELRESEQIKSILMMMEKDLLVIKSKAIIQENFTFTEDQLKNEFVKNRVQLDINYALIKETAVNVPSECTPVNGYRYIRNNPELFTPEKAVKLQFIFVADSSISDSLKISESRLLALYAQLFTPDGFQKKIINNEVIVDSSKTYFYDDLVDSLMTVLLPAKQHEQALIKAQEYWQKWRIGILADSLLNSSPFLCSDSTFGPYTDIRTIVSLAVNMDIGDVSSPVDTGHGYMVFQLADTQLPQLEAGLNYQKAWQTYTDNIKKSYLDDRVRHYYETNIDSFFTPVALITKLFVDNQTLATFQGQLSLEGLVRQFSQGVSDFELNTLSAAYGLDVKSQLLYINKWANEGLLSNKIAKILADNPNQLYGIEYLSNGTLLWKQSSWYDDFLPAYDIVKPYIEEQIAQIPADSLVIYEDFYNTHKLQFIRPDSLSIQGIVIPFISDTLVVNDTDIELYWQNKQNEFLSPESYSFSYIHLADPKKEKQEFLNYLLTRLDNDENFDKLAVLYSNDTGIKQHHVRYELVAPKFLSALKNMEANEISAPIYADSGWYIIRLDMHHLPRLRSLEESAVNIHRIIAHERSQKIAYAHAQTIYDSSQTFFMAQTFADSTCQIFESALQANNSIFPILGDITTYWDDFEEMRAGEKFSRLIPTDDAYVLIFLKRRKILHAHDAQLSFTEAMDNVRRAYRNFYRDENARAYVKNLVENIASGEDPDYLLKFFGGWHQLKNLKINSKIEGVPYSSLIIEDALRRQPGDYSRPLKISTDSFLFYQLEAKTHVSTNDFHIQKESFRRELSAKLYFKWLKNHKNNLSIEVQ